jgi:glycosyltransferase involved in cell wall biosynthesis
MTPALWRRWKPARRSVARYGLAVVVSPVGANCELVSHGKNGYLASDGAEWVEYLSALIRDANLRGRLGRCARQTIEARFSSERVSLQLRDVFLRAQNLGSELER